MSTRLKRPAFWRHLALALGLIAFQGYLGYSYFTGQFGIESQDVLEAEIDELGAQSGALQAEIDSYRHRVSLFKSSSLDPDLVTERALYRRRWHSRTTSSSWSISLLVNHFRVQLQSTTNELSGEIETGID